MNLNEDIKFQMDKDWCIVQELLYFLLITQVYS